MSSAETAFVFPGQGSQAVGMGRAVADAYPEAAAIFDTADEALGFELSRVVWSGPDEDLQLTANTQPALLTMSVALCAVLEAKGRRPAVVAGHSLGEYSALVAAGCLRFVDAVRLVRRRGELMQEAVPVGVGAMAAIIGLDAEKVEEVAESSSTAQRICAVSNLNAPGQIVIAGHKEAVECAVELAREAGAKRGVILPVSAPFHSPLMKPAREGMAPLLAETELRDPEIPVVCNVDARIVSTGEEARDGLIRQIDSPVRWVESIELMSTDLGVSSFLEVGPGKALQGMIRRIARGSSTRSVAEPDHIEALGED